MRNRFLLGMMALSLIGMTSCKDEIDQFDDHGSSTIVSFAGTEKAYMGDSITFDFEVKSGGVKINQAKSSGSIMEKKWYRSLLQSESRRKIQWKSAGSLPEKHA